MKILIYTLIFVLLNLPLAAQMPNWSWASIGTNTDYGYGESICIDKAGNAFMIGTFLNNLYIDTFILSSKGKYDLVITKHDATGNIKWAKQIGGKENDGFSGEAGSIATDEAGNVYVACLFSDSIEVDGNLFVSKGSFDIALFKFDNNGNYQWGKSYGSSLEETIRKIIVRDDNIYMLGIFSWQGTDSIFFDNNLVNSKGESDFFITKMDTSGNVIWARNDGTSTVDYAHGLAIDRQEHIIVTGLTSGNLYLDSDTIMNAVADALNFVICYDSNGNELWGKAARSTYGYYGLDNTVTDTNNNIYVTCYTINDQAINFGSIIVNNNFYNKAYLAKYSPNGQLLFAKKISSYTFYDAINSIKINPTDNAIYLCGSYNYLATFGTDTLHSYGHDDILLLKMNEQGNIIWSTHAGGSSADVAYGMAVTINGDIVLTGSTSSSNCRFGNLLVSAQDGAEIYVARLSQTNGVDPIYANADLTQVFPNPAENLVCIQSEQILEKIAIHDVTGRQMLDWNSNEVPLKQVCLNTFWLENGLYFISVSIDGKLSKPHRLLVQH